MSKNAGRLPKITGAPGRTICARTNPANNSAFRRVRVPAAVIGPALRLSLVARPPPTSCAWSSPPARSCATSNSSVARPPARPTSPPARLTPSIHLARGRQSEHTTTSLSVTPPTMHSPFVLAEKTLGAPNFASCGHQTGALPPISALPIYPHTATAGDAQMRLPGPLTSPEPRRLGTARREPAGKELAEPSPASLPAHGRSKGRGPARRLPPLSQPLPATGSRT